MKRKKAKKKLTFDYITLYHGTCASPDKIKKEGIKGEFTEEEILENYLEARPDASQEDIDKLLWSYKQLGMHGKMAYLTPIKITAKMYACRSFQGGGFGELSWSVLKDITKESRPCHKNPSIVEVKMPVDKLTPEMRQRLVNIYDCKQGDKSFFMFGFKLPHVPPKYIVDIHEFDSGECPVKGDEFTRGYKEFCRREGIPHLIGEHMK